MDKQHCFRPNAMLSNAAKGMSLKLQISQCNTLKLFRGNHFEVANLQHSLIDFSQPDLLQCCATKNLQPSGKASFAAPWMHALAIDEHGNRVVEGLEHVVQPIPETGVRSFNVLKWNPAWIWNRMCLYVYDYLTLHKARLACATKNDPTHTIPTPSAAEVAPY